jgi:hypothetical protein
MGSRPFLLLGRRLPGITGKRIRIAALHDEEWLESGVENPEDCISRLKASHGAPRADIFRFTQKVPATIPIYNYPMEMTSVAVAVEMCAARGVSWLTYGNFSYCNKGIDSLCEFKVRHGFSEMLVPTYYVPLTAWGRLCVLFKLYHKPQSVLPGGLRAIARKMRAKWYSLSTPKSQAILHPAGH